MEEKKGFDADEKTFLKHLGLQVRNARENIGFTPEMLGSKLEVEDSVVEAIEMGEKDITYLFLLKLSDAIEVAPQELLTENV